MAYQGPPRYSFVKIVDPGLNNEHAPAWFPYQTHQGAPVPGSLNQAFADPTRRARKRRQTLCYIGVTLAVCAIIILIAFLLAFFLTRKNKSDNGSTSTMQPVSDGSTAMHASTVSSTNGEQSTASGGSATAQASTSSSTINGGSPSASGGSATAQASTLSSTINGGSPSGSGGSSTVQVSTISGDQSTVSLSGTPSSLPSGSAVETTTTRSLQGNCSINQFQCGNGICIELARHCDSIADCGDSSDEANCECNETTHFRCTQSRECLSLEWKCDGLPDCLDVSDESNCGGCNETFLFGCNNTDRCIKKEWRCDGNQDCPDDSDETGCVCNPDSLFTCASTGRCIKLSWVCDGENDCPDGSEERNCTSIVRTTTTATVTL